MNLSLSAQLDGMIEINFDNSVALSAFLLGEYSSLPPGTRNPEPQFSKIEKRSKRILVIDDEVSIADSLTMILAGKGYDALAFYDGQAAIDYARTQCPDLVISDVIMPKLHGIDTLLAIRKLCPNARLVLFSGQAGTADLLKNAGAEGCKFDLLPKPIHPDNLLKRLSDLLK